MKLLSAFFIVVAVLYCPVHADMDFPAVIDLNGTVWVAWAHFDGEDDEIYCMHSDADGWSIPVQVNKKDSWPDICPVLKLSSEGVVSISWRGYDGKRYAAYSSCWDGEGWSEEVEEVTEVTEVTEVEEVEEVVVEDKYVGFGDSITWGARSTEGGYGPILEDKLRTIYPGAVVVLCGVGGERTSDGVERIDSVLAEEDGEYILILEGTNDIQAGISRETILFNLKEMVRKTIEHGSIPVLGTLPPRRDLEMWNRWTERLNREQIRPYARQEKILLADHWEFFYAEPDWEALIGRKDEHPNDAGYAVMADCWFVALEEDLPPSGLTAVIAGKTVRLSWEENSETGFEGYNVYRRAPYQAGYEKLNDCLITETNYCDEELTCPYYYYYAVTSVDTCGNESDYSIEVGIGLSSEDGGGCFIATACYGSSAAAEVKVLSKFRDEYLLGNIVGRAFVRGYYRVSPSLSRFIANRTVLRWLLRMQIMPFVRAAKAVVSDEN